MRTCIVRRIGAAVIAFAAIVGALLVGGVGLADHVRADEPVGRALARRQNVTAEQTLHARSVARSAQGPRTVHLPIALVDLDRDGVTPTVPQAPATPTTTPWAPATSDPTCASATPLGPSPTPLATVTPVASGTSEPFPMLRLVLASNTIAAQVGSGCWTDACRDLFCYATPREPVVVRSPLVGRLVLRSEQEPSDVSLQVFDVDGIEPAPSPSDPGRACWRRVGRGEGYAVGPTREHDVVIARRPGRYIVVISYWWKEARRDLTYGLYLEFVP